MAFSQAKIVVSGIIATEPNLRELDSGKVLLEVVISCRNGRKKKEEDQYEPSNMYSVTIWDNYANALKDVLNKGDRVTVFGHHVIETFELKDGSGKGTKSCIDNAEFLQTPTRSNISDDEDEEGTVTKTKATTKATSTKKRAVVADDIDEDVPF